MWFPIYCRLKMPTLTGLSVTWIKIKPFSGLYFSPCFMDSHRLTWLLVGLNYTEIIILERYVFCFALGLLRKNSFSVSLLYSQAHQGSGNTSVHTLPFFF